MKAGFSVQNACFALRAGRLARRSRGHRSRPASPRPGERPLEGVRVARLFAGCLATVVDGRLLVDEGRYLPAGETNVAAEGRAAIEKVSNDASGSTVIVFRLILALY